MKPLRRKKIITVHQGKVLMVNIFSFLTFLRHWMLVEMTPYALPLLFTASREKLKKLVCVVRLTTDTLNWDVPFTRKKKKAKVIKLLAQKTSTFRHE